MITVQDIQEDYKTLIETIRQQRDELKVKIHLANMEIRNEWEELEKKWQHLESKGKQLKREFGHSAHDIGDAAALLGGELKAGYKRIRQLL